MMPTLENLWRGNISPCVQCGANDPELQNLVKLMARNAGELRCVISESSFETLEKYVDCSNEYYAILTEKAFCHGFSLACKLLTEAASFSK